MKIKLYVLLMVFAGMFMSCEDFLEENSQNLVRPTTVQHYKETLYKESYPKRGEDDSEISTFFLRLDLMTDDVLSYSAEPRFHPVWNAELDDRIEFFGYFLWQKNPEIGSTGAAVSDEAWKWFYRSILVCNLVIENVPNAEGTPNEKTNLLGEAYFLRAWNYFNLVNTYGQPFKDATSAQTDLGVPINMLSTASINPLKRATLVQNYALIEADLKAAIQNLKATTLENNFFRANLPAAYLLASRVALFQQKYNDVISYADEGLKLKSALSNSGNTSRSTSNFEISQRNPELLFTFGENHIFTRGASISVSPNTQSVFISPTVPWDASRNQQGFGFTEELDNLYDSNDTRGNWLAASGGRRKLRIPTKLGGRGLGTFGYGMRTAEFYLNRAEAYLESGNTGAAISDLNTLRANRFSSGHELTVGSQEDTRKHVREERRRELCFEAHRWFDLRRWDRPRIEHKFIKSINVNGAGVIEGVFDLSVLEKDDPGYTLPIPPQEVLSNPNIIQNDRPIRAKTEVTATK